MVASSPARRRIADAPTMLQRPVRPTTSSPTRTARRPSWPTAATPRPRRAAYGAGAQVPPCRAATTTNTPGRRPSTAGRRSRRRSTAATCRRPADQRYDEQTGMYRPEPATSSRPVTTRRLPAGAYGAAGSRAARTAQPEPGYGSRRRAGRAAATVRAGGGAYGVAGPASGGGALRRPGSGLRRRRVWRWRAGGRRWRGLRRPAGGGTTAAPRPVATTAVPGGDGAYGGAAPAGGGTYGAAPGGYDVPAQRVATTVARRATAVTRAAAVTAVTRAVTTRGLPMAGRMATSSRRAAAASRVATAARPVTSYEQGGYDQGGYDQQQGGGRHGGPARPEADAARPASPGRLAGRLTRGNSTEPVSPIGEAGSSSAHAIRIARAATPRSWSCGGVYRLHAAFAGHHSPDRGYRVARGRKVGRDDERRGLGLAGPRRWSFGLLGGVFGIRLVGLSGRPSGPGVPRSGSCPEVPTGRRRHPRRPRRRDASPVDGRGALGGFRVSVRGGRLAQFQSDGTDRAASAPSSRLTFALTTPAAKTASEPGDVASSSSC